MMRLCGCFVRDTDGSIPRVASVADIRLEAPGCLWPKSCDNNRYCDCYEPNDSQNGRVSETDTKPGQNECDWCEHSNRCQCDSYSFWN